MEPKLVTKKEMIKAIKSFKQYLESYDRCFERYKVWVTLYLSDQYIEDTISVKKLSLYTQEIENNFTIMNEMLEWYRLNKSNMEKFIEAHKKIINTYSHLNFTVEQTPID